MQITTQANIASYLGVPIILNDGTMFGTLCAVGSKVNSVCNEDIENLTNFASFIANSIDLKTAYQKIKKHDERLLKELEMAKSIQQSVLPKDIVTEDIKISTIYTPSEHLSGDMYSYYRIDNNRYGVILIDVMGHGVSSALVSMSIRSLLYGLITQLTDPLLVITELNNHMIHLFKDQKQLNTYATAFYMVIDMDKQEIEYVNAGHPSPILISKESGEVVELSEGTLPLGILKVPQIIKGMVPFQSASDMMVYTDGILEILPPSSNKMNQRIIHLYQETEQNFHSLNRYIQNKINQTDSQPDDVCLIFIEMKERNKNLSRKLTQKSAPCSEEALDELKQYCLESIQYLPDKVRKEIDFVVNEALINALEATSKKYGQEMKQYFLSMCVEATESSIIIKVTDQADGNKMKILNILENRTFEDVLESERGRGLLFIKHMVDEIWFEGTDNEKEFTIAMRKEVR